MASNTDRKKVIRPRLLKYMNPFRLMGLSTGDVTLQNSVIHPDAVNVLRRKYLKIAHYLRHSRVTDSEYENIVRRGHTAHSVDLFVEHKVLMMVLRDGSCPSSCKHPKLHQEWIGHHKTGYPLPCACVVYRTPIVDHQHQGKPRSWEENAYDGNARVEEMATDELGQEFRCCSSTKMSPSKYMGSHYEDQTVTLMGIEGDNPVGVIDIRPLENTGENFQHHQTLASPSMAVAECSLFPEVLPPPIPVKTEQIPDHQDPVIGFDRDTYLDVVRAYGCEQPGLVEEVCEMDQGNVGVEDIRLWDEKQAHVLEYVAKSHSIPFHHDSISMHHDSIPPPLNSIPSHHNITPIHHHESGEQVVEYRGPAACEIYDHNYCLPRMWDSKRLVSIISKNKMANCSKMQSEGMVCTKLTSDRNETLSLGEGTETWTDVAEITGDADNICGVETFSDGCLLREVETLVEDTHHSNITLPGIVQTKPTAHSEFRAPPTPKPVCLVSKVQVLKFKPMQGMRLGVNAVESSPPGTNGTMHASSNGDITYVVCSKMHEPISGDVQSVVSMDDGPEYVGESHSIPFRHDFHHDSISISHEESDGHEVDDIWTPDVGEGCPSDLDDLPVQVQDIDTRQPSGEVIKAHSLQGHAITSQHGDDVTTDLEDIPVYIEGEDMEDESNTVGHADEIELLIEPEGCNLDDHAGQGRDGDTRQPDEEAIAMHTLEGDFMTSQHGDDVTADVGDILANFEGNDMKDENGRIGRADAIKLLIEPEGCGTFWKVAGRVGKYHVYRRGQTQKARENITSNVVMAYTTSTSNDHNDDGSDMMASWPTAASDIGQWNDHGYCSRIKRKHYQDDSPGQKNRPNAAQSTEENVPLGTGTSMDTRQSNDKETLMIDTQKSNDKEMKIVETHQSNDLEAKYYKRVSKKGGFHCLICSQSHRIRGAMRAHVRTHLGPKPYKCPHCDRAFTHSSLLKAHKKRQGGKVLECTQCDAKFSFLCEYKRHLREVHTRVRTQGAFPCKHCGKAFRTSRHLAEHTVKHTGEKLYQCHICGEMSSTDCNLYHHIQIHTREWQCDVCGKFFARKDMLNQHMKVHTGERPYPCDVCGRCFAVKASLNNHMVVHTGGKPYLCHVCGNFFARKDVLKRHMKRAHTGESNTRVVCAESV